MKKKTVFFISILIWGVILSGCSKTLNVNIYSWMYDASLSESEIVEGLSKEADDYHQWNNVELIEGIYGTFDYNQYHQYWTWSLYCNEDTFSKILRALRGEFNVNSTSEIEGYDAAYKFQTIPFLQEGTYDETWSWGIDEDSTMLKKLSEEERKIINNRHHSFILLKKGDHISLQYIALSTYEGFDTKYYDFEKVND